jgi:aminoglycoside N3'-acetyltransferase
MGKKYNKEDTIIKDDGVRIIFKNDIVHSVIYTKCTPAPLTNYQRKNINKREQKHIASSFVSLGLIASVITKITQKNTGKKSIYKTN